ncbi:MAG: hypothetical protein JKX78_06770 [Alteromonadaceae bacterium]|nr:hypothetical protein [Alteromonadaceae bacterium]
MRSIFIRIYVGILLAMVAIILLLSIATYYTNKYRINMHIKQNYSGTFQLIGEGVARHHGEQRQQWLLAIEKLTDLTFKQYTFNHGPLKKADLKRLNQQNFIFNLNAQLSEGQVFIRLPNSQNYLTTHLNDFGSSLVRISAFLVLNELGRHKNAQRLVTLEKLRTMFNYPIQLKSVANLHLPSSNIRTIKKGNIAVVLKNSTRSESSLMAYAPLGNSPYALVLGGISMFEWFPFPLIATLIIITLFLMASSVYWLVRPLEKRLAAVDKQIEQIGHDKSLSMPTTPSHDGIGKLSNTVNSMSARIHALLTAQDEMIRAISHELRTPATRIRFRLAMLETPQGITENQHLLGIEKDLNELEKLIDEVLTFSKLKRQSPKLFIEEIQLKEFFQQLLKNTEIINQDISIKFNYENNACCSADKRYLFRALENLLINALKYSHQHIEIGFRVSEKMQHLWVADDGVGIPEQQRVELFEPFKRLDSSRDRKSGGYGLGLAIVKQIANWHQGNVDISDSKRGGAQINFYWPVIIKSTGVGDAK